MPPVTRQRAKEDVASTSATVAASASKADARRASANAKRQQILQNFKETINKKDVTIDELNEVMLNKPNSYWDYSYWSKAIHAWIENKRWTALVWYMKIHENADGWSKMPFMTDILDTMSKLHPITLFTVYNPVFTEMREAIKNNTYSWWINHLKNSSDNDEYLFLMLRNNWKPFPMAIIRDLERERTPELITEAAKYTYRTYGGIELFQNGEYIYKYVNGSYNQRALLLALIVNRPSSSPLIANPDAFHGLRYFISSCLAGENHDMLDAFVSKFSMKHEGNKMFLQQLLEWMIVPIFGYAHSRPAELNTTYAVVEFIVKRYKINVNNLYINLEAFAKTRAKEPLNNPYTWMSNNLSVMAYAVMYKNKRAILFLQSLGATLRRCAFAMEDLTNDPTILRLFHTEKKATHIQQSYKQYLYSTSHTSQATRQSAWDSRLSQKQV